MKPLLVIKEEDIFPDTPPYEIDDGWKDRVTVKVIVFDDENKMALYGVGHPLLPGGGVEGDETLEEAVRRECLEEIGCNVEVLEEVGVTEECRLRIKRKQETHCFLAKVIGKKGKPQSKQEDEQEAKTEWMPIEEALASLKRTKKIISPLSYHSQFNVRTHIAFLEKYLGIAKG